MKPHPISWTDRTWNPTRGCSRISEGCRNCYAERIAARFSKGRADKPKRQGEFQGFAILTPSGPRWTGNVELVESKLTEPLHWRKPQRVFVNSMSDLFHEALPDEAIDRVFLQMVMCPRHTFQILTKRPQRMLDYVSSKNMPFMKTPSHPLLNVWLGVSVEDQETADERIPLLLQTPAAVRFVSYEPALGPVDFTQWMRYTASSMISTPRLDWIIAGGESGPGARPPHPDWFRKTRDQCVAAGVAYFFKQWGAWREPGIGEEYTTQHGRAGKPPAFIVQHNGTVECFKNPAHDRAGNYNYAPRRIRERGT